MSLNLDTDQLFAITSDLFNAFWPVAAVVAGIGLAFTILNFVVKAFRQRF